MLESWRWKGDGLVSSSSVSSFSVRVGSCGNDVGAGLDTSTGSVERLRDMDVDHMVTGSSGGFDVRRPLNWRKRR